MTYITMNEALAHPDWKVPPLIPAIRVGEEIFSHPEGHDMAMDAASEKYDLTTLRIANDDFGYILPDFWVHPAPN